MRGFWRFVQSLCLLAALLPAAPSHAAVTATVLASDTEINNATLYQTASVTPGSNRLVLAAIATTDSTTPVVTPTASGNGLTWVQVATIGFNPAVGEASRLTVFRAMGAAPTAGAISFSFSAEQSGAVWSVVEFAGVDTGGTNGSAAVVQSATNAADAVASLTVTLAAFGAVQNATYGVFGVYQANSVVDLVPGTGFTALYEQIDGGSNWPGLISEWRSDPDTSVDATNTANTADWGGVAIEIKAAGTLIPSRRLLRKIG